MQPPSSTAAPLSFATRIALGVLGLLLFAMAIMAVQLLTAPTRSDGSPTRLHGATAQRYKLLTRQIEDLIQEEEAANHITLSKARHTLAKTFGQYAARVPRFSEKIASLQTRLSIVAKSSTAASQQNREADAYIRKIFEQKVVTSRQMRHDIKKIILQFHEDLEANRTALVTHAAQRIQQARLGDAVPDAQETLLHSKIAAHIRVAQQNLAAHTSDISPQSYQGNGIAEDASHALNAQIIRISTSNVLIEVLLQAGTAVGLVVGLGIGYLADEWLSMRLQKKITKKTRMTLARMQQDLWRHPQNGMKVKMERVIAQSKQINVAAIDKVVLSMVS